MVKYTFLLFLIISVNAWANIAPLADPTRPIDYQSLSANKKSHAALPKLQSILAEGKQRRAIIDNQLYTVGQWVNGYQITHIKKGMVLLNYKNRAYRLTLYTEKERFIK